MKIVFFDGECNLCNFFVDFLIRHDDQRQLHFASLQGETARKKIPALAKPPYSSVVFYHDGRISTESTAALDALNQLSGAWKLAPAFKLIPKFIRNFVYRQIARNRYKLFGKKETCRLPTSEERAYFLP